MDAPLRLLLYFRALGAKEVFCNVHTQGRSFEKGLHHPFRRPAGAGAAGCEFLRWRRASSSPSWVKAAAAKPRCSTFWRRWTSPTEGHVFLGNGSFPPSVRRKFPAFRRDHLGFVFQDFNLLDTFTLRDNILLPLVLASTPYRGDGAASEAAGGQAGHHSASVQISLWSGGWKRRAAVAAPDHRARLLLADEAHRRAGQQGLRRPAAYSTASTKAGRRS